MLIILSLGFAFRLDNIVKMSGFWTRKQLWHRRRSRRRLLTKNWKRSSNWLGASRYDRTYSNGGPKVSCRCRCPDLPDCRLIVWIIIVPRVLFQRRWTHSPGAVRGRTLRCTGTDASVHRQTHRKQQVCRGRLEKSNTHYVQALNNLPLFNLDLTVSRRSKSTDKTVFCVKPPVISYVKRHLAVIYWNSFMSTTKVFVWSTNNFILCWSTYNNRNF